MTTGAGETKALAEIQYPDNDPLGRWGKRWGPGRQIIRAESRTRTEPSKDKKLLGPSPDQKAESLVWSGFVAFRETQEAAINSVEGVWVVPNCYPPKDAVEGQWYTCSSWIGIDGDTNSKDGSTDILQVGVDSDVMQFAGVVTRWVCAWWEWFPGGSNWIPAFPISPGDTLDVVVAMKKGSKTEATIYLHNRTSGAATSIPITAPAGTELTGNCAEWIVEKANLPATASREFASYGEVCFDQAKAYTDKDEILRPSEKFCRLYRMLDDKEQVISQGEVGSDLVRCVYKGLTPTDILLPSFIK
jgi:hypothetical protein